MPVVADKPIRLRFGEMEAALAQMHGIADTKRTKFQARLKNFHRLGFPLGFESQAGKASLYAPGAVVEMALAIEMTQLGIPPERLTHVLSLNRFPTFMAMVMAAGGLVAAPVGFDPEIEKEDDPLSMFLFFDPAGLSSLMSDNPEITPDDDATDDTFFYGGAAVVRDNFVRWTTGSCSRISLINLTSVIDMAANCVYPGDVLDDAAIQFKKSFFQEVFAYAEDRLEETYEHEAEYFALKMIEQRYAPPEDEVDLTEIIERLVSETGLKTETIASAVGQYIETSRKREGNNGDS